MYRSRNCWSTRKSMSQLPWTVDWFAKHAWINFIRKEDFPRIDRRCSSCAFWFLLSAGKLWSLFFLCHPACLRKRLSPFASSSLSRVAFDSNNERGTRSIAISLSHSYRIVYTVSSLISASNSIANLCPERMDALETECRICGACSLRTTVRTRPPILCRRQGSL